MTAPSVASLVFSSCGDSATVTVSLKRADRELDVEPRALADLERDHLRALLEAGQLDVDLIAAGDQVDDLIRRRSRSSTWCDSTLVARLVTVTVAPGTTPPPVSRTTPLSVARSTCACAIAPVRSSTAPSPPAPETSVSSMVPPNEDQEIR